MPEMEIMETTAFTGASFYHFERDEIKGKVFLIEDLDGAQEVMFPIRELQTKKRISKTMAIKEKNGGLKTVTLTVEGPVSVIGCTTKEKIYEDNANRSLLIHLDGSKEQDDRIMDYQKKRKAGQIDRLEERQKQTKLRRMQQVLESITVINPYAPLIDLPQEVFKPRRTLPLLLSFIEAITFYHQRQRDQKVDKETGEVYIETSPEDIENGFDLLADVLFRKADELSGAAREFYEYMKQWDKKRDRSTDPKQGGFFASMIRRETRIHPRTLSRYLQELCDFGLIEITGGNKYRAGYSYKVIGGRDFQSIQKRIEQQIEKVKKAVRAAHIERTKSKVKRGRPRKAVVEQ
jgi:DNA-binding HxlR family transcriptional regulator